MTTILDPHTATAQRDGAPLYNGLAVPMAGQSVLHAPAPLVVNRVARGTALAVRRASGWGRYWWIVQPGSPFAGLTIADHDSHWSVRNQLL